MCINKLKYGVGDDTHQEKTYVVRSASRSLKRITLHVNAERCCIKFKDKL